MFRLPIHLYNLLAKICAEEGIRPSVYVERLTIAHLEGKYPTPKGGGPKPFLGKFEATRILEESDGST